LLNHKKQVNCCGLNNNNKNNKHFKNTKMKSSFQRKTGKEKNGTTTVHKTQKLKPNTILHKTQ